MSFRTLSLEALRSFVAICETGSFRRAASRVHKSPSAVSLQIAKLEEVLDTRLMDRDARHVELTEDGSTLLARARHLLGINDETIALFQKSQVTGRLALAAPHDLGVSLVPGFLRHLAGVYPDLQVDVRLGTTDFIKTELKAGSVNLGLFNDISPEGDGATTLYAEPLAWLSLKGGRAVHQNPLPLAVAEVRCTWREAALGALHAADRHYRVAYSSDTSMGQVAAVRADLAIAALPISLADRDLSEAPSDMMLPPLPKAFVQVADDGSELAKVCVAVLVEGSRSQTPFAAE
ncbi:MAG: LysR family transcriptional regulator [Sulfitobacter pontiacus]|uniref:LysR family transcriptional regulator n=1 Tax=Sulfitobacter pontiacus TaxID=60137 RepID=UPI003264DABD